MSCWDVEGLMMLMRLDNGVVQVRSWSESANFRASRDVTAWRGTKKISLPKLQWS